MFHLVAHALPRQLLFRTWTEGVALWRQLNRSLPAATLVVLMPDHVHLLHAQDVRPALAAALAGYVRWRNARRGERGPGITTLPAAEALADEDKVRRSIRYGALNPCRARLVPDPLSWPLSSYRDVVGMAIDPVRKPHPDPEELHAHVSADPSVHVRGTPLPVATVAVPSPGQVADTVSALTRTPLSELHTRGRARSLYLRAAVTLCDAKAAEIATYAACSLDTVHRARRGLDDDLRLVARVVGDPRFGALADGDLRRLPTWQRYRTYR